MKWGYWICLFTETHCAARGLRPSTIAAYKATLYQFRGYIEVQADDINPDQISARHVLEYIEYLRRERNNNAAAINRQVTILKNFYKAIVAMGHLEPSDNPLSHFPKIKAQPRKLPDTLSTEEVERLLTTPPDHTVIGLRDRAILTLLYGTGIRASECACLQDKYTDLEDQWIQVAGKGGHERRIPLNDRVTEVLRLYRQVRGKISPDEPFFRNRSGRGMSRNAIYERVRKYARCAKIHKRVSPHRLRHTFATHLVRAGVGLVIIRDLLGHRQITSTQIYLQVTAQDLREAAAKHPIRNLTVTVSHILPDMKLAFQGRAPTIRYG